MEFIQYSKTNHIARVTINRPSALNAFNYQLIEEMTEIFEQIPKDPEVYCVIIDSAVPKAFTSGGDIKLENTLTVETALDFAKKGKYMLSLIEDCPYPVIAAVNGYALGAGLEIMLVADIVVVAKNAIVGVPTINLGGIPGWGSMLRLPQRVGRSRALDLLLTGRKISGMESYEYGLAEYVVDEDRLHQKAWELAEIIADKAPGAIRAMKECVLKCSRMDREKAFEVDNELYAYCYSLKDHQEAMHAFLEKRPHREFKNC